MVYQINLNVTIDTDYIEDKYFIDKFKDLIGDLAQSSDNIVYSIYPKKSYYTEGNSLAYSYHLDDYVFQTKDDANKAVDALLDILKANGVVRVSDYKKVCGLSLNFFDNLYGWKNMDGWKITGSWPTYMIIHPDPVLLKESQN